MSIQLDLFPVITTEMAHRIIENRDGLYKGSLVAFHKRIKKYAAELPYHNLKHNENVMCLAWFWCNRYKSKLTKDEITVCIISALGHDLGYKLRYRSKDTKNTRRALKIIRNNLKQEPWYWKYFYDVAQAVKATTYPYPPILGLRPNLVQEILRVSDASLSLFDGSYAGETTTTQLAHEWQVPVKDVYKIHEMHYLNLLSSIIELKGDTLLTSLIEQQTKEVRRMIRKIKTTPAVA